MITSNFNRTSLLYLSTFEVDYDNQKFYFTIPKLKDTLKHGFNLFMVFCSMEEKELRKFFEGVNFVNRYHLLVQILSIENEVAPILYKWFQFCIKDFEYRDDSLMAGEFLITSEVFDLFCTYIAIACGQKKIDVLVSMEEEKNLTPEEREWNRRMREHQAIIDRARKKADENGLELDIIIACLMREFGLTLDQVFELNYYTIFFLFEQVGKIARYNVDVIAAGNGLLPKGQKHKYWINT